MQVKGHGEKLSRKQEAAIGALLSCGTIGDAAAACGVSSVSLWRWMQQPAFAAEYRGARARVVDAAISSLTQAASAAVGTLERNLTCQNFAVEVRSAQIILEQVVKIIEMGEMAERIEKLEASFQHGNIGTSQSFGALRR